MNAQGIFDRFSVLAQRISTSIGETEELIELQRGVIMYSKLVLSANTKGGISLDFLPMLEEFIDIAQDYLNNNCHTTFLPGRPATTHCI